MGQLNIVVDHTRVAPGMVTSRKAMEMLRLIESCSGVPEEALSLIFRKSRQLLAKLRGAGMIYRVKGGGKIIWLPRDVPPPGVADIFMQKVAAGWLAARLVEANGRYENGFAVFPNGAKFCVAMVPPAPLDPCLAVFLNTKEVQLCKGSVWVMLDDLQSKSLKECLQSGD